MRISNVACKAIAMAVLAFSAGCGGSGPQSGQTAVLPSAQAGSSAAQSLSAQRSTGTGQVASLLPPGFQHPLSSQMQPAAFNNAAAKRTLFISDSTGNFIDAFAPDGTLAARLTSGLSAPQGLCVDAAGNLWVANTAAGNVLVFAPGAMAPHRIIKDSAGPVAVAVAPDGTAYVSNQFGNGGANVTVYAPGSNKIERTLADPAAQQIFFVITNKSGDVFLSVMDVAFVGRIDEFFGGKQAGFKRLPITLQFPGGIRLRNGFILASDQLAFTVTEFTQAGMPTGNIVFTGGDWVDFNVSPSGFVLVGADTSHIQGTTRTWPTGMLGRAYSDPAFQIPIGVAFEPAQ